MTKKLAIIGAGGLGREVAWLVERINRISPVWEIAGFIDRNIQLIGQTIGNYPVLGGNEWIMAHRQDTYAVCAIGSARIRKGIVRELAGVKYATLVDPSVIISDRVAMGEGCILCAGSVLTVDIRLGSHVVLNPDCKIGHDAVLGDYVTLYPSVNISGNTELGECVEMGVGSMVLQGLKIKEGTIIGAGAVVIDNLPEACTAVGVPAKPVKFHD